MWKVFIYRRHRPLPTALCQACRRTSNAINPACRYFCRCPSYADGCRMCTCSYADAIVVSTVLFHQFYRRPRQIVIDVHCGGRYFVVSCSVEAGLVINYLFVHQQYACTPSKKKNSTHADSGVPHIRSHRGSASPWTGGPELPAATANPIQSEGADGTFHPCLLSLFYPHDCHPCFLPD
jgi:hypothetical protein